MIRIEITMNDQGQLSINGPTNNIPLVVGILELSKTLIINAANSAPQNAIVPAPASALDLLTK